MAYTSPTGRIINDRPEIQQFPGDAQRRREAINKSISLHILAKVQAGMPVQTAFDDVLGEGAYVKLANDIWETVNSAKS